VKPTAAEVRDTAKRLHREAEGAGYHLNPNREFTEGLVEGLLTNEGRYGYWACPCRLAAGTQEKDLDIICPCDYRDPDLAEYGTCYCALYVSREVLDGNRKLTPIPERRLSAGPQPGGPGPAPQVSPGRPGALPYPVWRCRVCGYLCARKEPPEVCPICKAKKERFERFL